MKLSYIDSKHSYWLNGTRVKSASKVAQIAADSFTIEQWQKRQVAIGMTLDPTFAERVAMDLENRETIQTVCEEAANLAKANSRAQRGTQRHRVLELMLLGRHDQFITDQQRADAVVLQRTLDAYGLEPIPDRVEQFVAWPDNGVVGRYDAYLYHHACGMPVLCDLKGGENAVKYPHSTAVQLWLYRNAPHTSARIERDGDKSVVTEWTTMPEGAATDFAYVIYCDDHHDVGELWKIDLEAARRGGELALEIVDWRKRHDYGRALAKPIENKEKSCQTTSSDPSLSVERTLTSSSNDSTSITTIPTDHTSSSSPPRSSSSTDESPQSDRRAALLARYDAMSDDEQKAFRDLHVDRNDLDAVEAALNQVDRFNVAIPSTGDCDSCPTPALDCSGCALARKPKLAVVPPPAPPPDEGAPVSEADVLELSIRYEKLTPEAKAWTGALVAQGNQGHTWRIRNKPTERRYWIYRGVLDLAEWSNGGADDIVRAIVAAIRPTENIDFTTVPPGLAIGLLDAEQAAYEFASTASAVAADKFALVYNEDGGPPTLTPAA